MEYYCTTAHSLGGHRNAEVKEQARFLLRHLTINSRRKKFVRSPYFRKRKVFFDFFLTHIFQKPEPERIRRLKLLPLAIDLIKNSKLTPESKINPENKKEILHRIIGKCSTNQQLFAIHIKERLDTKKLQCVSVFPIKNLPPG